MTLEQRLSKLSDEFTSIHADMQRLVNALDNEKIAKAQRFLMFDQLSAMAQYAKTVAMRMDLLSEEPQHQEVLNHLSADMSR